VNQMLPCKGCGNPVHITAISCPSCGAIQKEKPVSSKNRVTAAVLAFLLGGIGIHKFYLGEVGKGFLYLIFFWTFIPSLLALITFVQLVCMSDEQFAARYPDKPAA